MFRSISTSIVTVFVTLALPSFAVELPAGFTANNVEAGYWQMLAEKRHLLSQIDTRLKAAHLIPNGPPELSALCGPVAASIGFTAYRKSQGHDVTSKTVLNEIRRLSDETMRLRQQDILNGLYTTYELAEVTETYRSILLPAVAMDFESVDLLYDTEITRSSLTAKSEMEFLILKLAITDNSGKTSNHFVIQVAQNSETGDVMIADPFYPMEPIRAQVIPAAPFGAPTFRLKLRTPFKIFKSEDANVEGVLRVRIH